MSRPPRSLRLVVLVIGLALVAGACSSGRPGAEIEPPTGTAIEVETDADAPATTSLPSDDDADTAAEGESTPPSPPLAGSLVPEVIATFPHDPDAYTQGLEVHEGALVESTGRYGESDRRLVDVDTGEVTEIVALPDELFGEGLTIVDGELLQLTWQSEILLRADADTLAETSTGTYRGEGRGLCHDGEQLVMSNGSAELTLRDPSTFEVDRTVVVTRDDGAPVERLNELECVGGQVLANVYRSDEIVVIDPTNGSVDASIDASSLRPDGAPADDADYALNGIAHDPESGSFYLTGKWWPVLYEVRFVDS